ncbi:MAG: Bacterial dnaA protein helix-turn-helix [Patescibacteria group bacterium]|nr:Bacterial dnaA protein helix-turn-helix [Patescibacteria group bacterium]
METNRIVGETIALHGRLIFLNAFPGVVEPEVIRSIVAQKIIPNCEKALPIHRAILVDEFVHELHTGSNLFPYENRGRSFFAYFSRRVRKVLARFRQRVRANEDMVSKMARALEKVQNSQVRSNLQAFTVAVKTVVDDAKKRMRDREESQPPLSPQEFLVARSLLSQLADPIAVMLGLLRVIPLSNRQRDMEFFEGFFGLNGRTKLSFRQLAEKWRVNWATPQKAIDYIWHRLEVAKSPITNPEHLQRLLKRIQAFERKFRETIPISPLLPSVEEQVEIGSLFAREKETWKQAAKDRPYELQFKEFTPIIQDTHEETLVFIVCQVFGLTPKQLSSSSSLTRFARARYIAAYLLDVDLKISPQRIGRLIGRGAHMARYGRYHTAKAIADKQEAVIHAVETIRRLYRGLK